MHRVGDDEAAVVSWQALKSANQVAAEARVAALLKGEDAPEMPVSVGEANPAGVELKRRRNGAIQLHNQAVDVVSRDKQTAYRMLCSCVTVDPELAQGWYALGNATADLNMFDASVACFRRALALGDTAEPGGMNPELRAKCLVNLSHRLTNIGETFEAMEVNQHAIDMLLANPDLDWEGRAFAYTNLSQIWSVLDFGVDAIDAARRGWELNQSPIIELGLAFALMFHGDLAEGLKHFESRFGYRLQSYLEYPYERWDGKTDHNKTLFVVSEQGLGDTISFARFLGMVGARCKKVIFQVHPELHRLMSASLKHWGNIECVPLSTQFPVADAWCSVMSLPVAMDLTTEQITNIKQGWTPRYEKRPAPEWKYPGPGLHVGVAWAGSAANGIDKWRSVPMVMFLQLAKVAGVRLYSLQVGERVQDMHEAGAAALVRDLSPYIRDVADTCAILDELDMVVSVESFLGHLCGAMGKECWLLASQRGGDWRLGRSREKSLWYDNHRLFRQGPDGEWQPVFKRLVEALHERCGS